MKSLILSVLLLNLAHLHADEERTIDSKALSESEYREKFALTKGDSGEKKAIQKCLAHWTKHPFGKEPAFRTIQASVKVFGIGKDIEDEVRTAYPQMILIKPSVNVMGGTNFRLLNPNGWYCFKANVTVLAKSEITAQCKANVTTASDEVEVAGNNSAGQGVTVLGKTEIKRLGCPEKK